MLIAKSIPDQEIYEKDFLIYAKSGQQQYQILCSNVSLTKIRNNGCYNFLREKGSRTF
jgi:hypothetical protein